MKETYKTLLDPARLPERPVGPSRKVVSMAGGGIGLAFGLAFVGLFTRRRPESRP